MSAEGMPPTEPSLLARPLGWLARCVLRRPVAVLALAVTVALVSVVLTGGRLRFRTSRLDLLDPECHHNRLWVDYINEFGAQDDVVIVVQGAGREKVVPVLEDLSSALLREDRFFHAVLHEVNLAKIRSKGLYYLSENELLGIEAFLDEAMPIVAGDWQRLNLSNMTDELCLQLHDPRLAAFRPVTLAKLDRFSASLLTQLTNRERYRSPWPEMSQSVATLSELGPEYLLTNQGRWGLVLLRLAANTNNESFAPASEAIDTLRGLIAEVQARHPDVRIGLTGLPVMEDDEMRSSQQSMVWASLLSLIGVACLYVAGYGGVRHPLLNSMVLLLGTAWTFGFITLAIGHLNILSMAFASILIGLGDFGVHVAARYLQLRSRHKPVEEALVETVSGVGPGIITGAVTAAISFFMAVFTEFVGVAELGLIAAAGIVLCCLAALVVLPAMIYLADRHRTRETLPAPLDIHGWLRPVFARPRAVVMATAVGTLLLMVGMSRLRYDHNLLNLQPEGLESVALEQQLLTESDQSVWFALSIAESREELLARKERFLALPSVSRVEEIASLFPVDHEQKRPIIERIQRRLESLPERPPVIPIDPPAEVGRALARAQILVGNGADADKVIHQIEQVREAMRHLTEEECSRRLSECQHGIASDLLSRLFRIRTMANPDPPKLDDLPESLVTRFVGQGRDRYLMKIYSKADIWDMDAMQRFVAEVRRVDPEATGSPLQTYEASREMKTSYEEAACYALVFILVTILIDFGRLRWTRLAAVLAVLLLGAGAAYLGRMDLSLTPEIRMIACLVGSVVILIVGAWVFGLPGVGYTLLVILPVGLGMLQLFGIMGILDVPLHPANMIVLPLILGIGVDNGVHIVHDYRRQRGPYHMTASTANAIVITSLTTMVGFGSLMIASHRGLQSLGRVLTIGVSCCLFASLIMLPAILSWATRRRPEVEEEDVRPAAPAVGHPIRRRDPAEHPGTSPHAAPPAVRPVARLSSRDDAA